MGVALVSVSKEYEGHKMAIQNLSLTFHRGQITALLGTNGAGKTTIMCVPAVCGGLRVAVPTGVRWSGHGAGLRVAVTTYAGWSGTWSWAQGGCSYW